MLKKAALLALPAVAMAFGPALPLASTPGLARAAHCRAAAPALRMAVSEVGSESELDAAIANAGLPRLPALRLPCARRGGPGAAPGVPCGTTLRGGRTRGGR